MNITEPRDRLARARAGRTSRRRHEEVSLALILLFAASAHPVQAAPANAPTALSTFSPPLIAVGGSSLLTITLTNDNDDPINGVGFADYYPAPVNVINSGIDTVVSNTCNASINAPPNATFVVAASGTILPHQSCSIAVNVVGTVTGSSINSTGPITSNNAPTGAPYTSTLTITGGALLAAPTVSNLFAPASVPNGGTSALIVHIDNVENIPITGARFSDAYPFGIANVSDGPVIAADSCLGTLSADPGASGFSLIDGVVPAGSGCDVVVNVLATAPGIQITNSTTTVLSGNAYPGNAATGTLTITNDLPLFEPVATIEFLPSDIVVGGTSQMHLAISNFNGSSMNGVGLTAHYIAPIHMTNASSDAIVENTCGGTVVADDNATVVSLSNAQIAPDTTCDIRINVAGTSAGVSDVQTSAIASSNARSGASVTESLTVEDIPLLSSPVVTKTFTPSSVVVGGTTQMTITLLNTNLFGSITGLQFKDAYPPGMANAPQDIVTTNTCGGTITADPDGTSLELIGGSLQANPECIVQINVVGTTPTPQIDNHTGIVSSANALPGADASGTLAVADVPLLPAPAISMVFAPDSVVVGGSTALTITLTNPGNAIVEGVQFKDPFPGGMSDSAYGVVVNTCGGSTDDGPDYVSLVNGEIPANGSCQIVVQTLGTAVGSVINTTTSLTSSNAATAPGASATLTVDAGGLLQAPAVTKSFLPSTVAAGGHSQMTLVFANPNQFDAITGVQAFDSYPAGLENASDGVVVSNTCGGNVVAGPGTASTVLVNGSIPPQQECTVRIDVVGTTANTLVDNHTGIVSSGNAVASADASAQLTVTSAPLLLAPTITKTFSPSDIVVGGTSQMVITLTNPNGGPIAGAQVDDIYPNGMVNAPGNPVVSDTCNFIEDVPGNGSWAKLANGTIPSPSCSIVIAVVGTSTATNNTGPVPSANASTGSSASGTLTVESGGGNAQTITFTSAAPNNATVGGPPYHAIASASSGLPVVLTIDGASATVCTIDGSGMVGFIGPGSCTIDANQGGGMNGGVNYAPAPQTQQWFVVGSAGGATPQTITFTSTAPNNATVLGPPYAATATAGSGLPVVFTIDGSSATVCTIDSGSVSFVGPGTCTIDANQGGGMNGGTNYAPATQVQQWVVVASAGGVTPQMITFSSSIPSNAKVGGATYIAAATATSGLPVVLTIDGTSATVCTINAGTVNFIGPGMCTIDANQGGGTSGGTNYAPAPQAHQSFAVASAGGVTPQAITFTSAAPNNAKVAGPAYPATATSTSGLAVVLTIDATSANVCTINNGTVSFVGAGTCKVDANQGGNGTYAPAPQIQQFIAVASAGGVTPQTITFTSTPPAHAGMGGPTYLALATAAPSGLPVILTIDVSSAAVCTINYGEVGFIGAGTCTIDANQGGNAIYAPAPQKQQLFAVSDGSGNHAPIGVGDAIEVAPNDTSSALVGDANVPASVLDNDHDADGDSLTAVKLSDPAHGDLLQFNPDGTFVYKNTSNAATDSFTYKACDVFACSPPTTVTITIGTGLDNHLPFATDDAIQVAPHAATADIVGDAKTTDSVLDNDVDPDGDALTASKLTDPTHGDLVFNANGTFSYQNHPNDNATTDTFAYSACDTDGACDLGVVSITIGNAPADHIPVVVDDAIQVAHGQSASTLIGDLNVPGSVLDNDSDPDAGDTLTAVKVGALLNNSGSISLNADGTFTYTNTDQQATTDTVLYEACDNIFACTAGIITISINSNPPDVAPIAMDDAIVVGPHGATGILVGGGSNVLTNDSDPADSLTAHLISAPANGHVTLNADGTFTYFNDDPAPGVDSWRYEACDSYGACSGATVSVTIDPNAPTVTCVLPRQVDIVGDTVNIDLSLLFAPPPNESLSYGATNLPPSLSVVGSLLTGTLQPGDVALSPYASTLRATTVPAGVSATENVVFQVLPTGEVLFRDGFDGPGSSSQPCQ